MKVRKFKMKQGLKRVIAIVSAIAMIASVITCSNKIVNAVVYTGKDSSATLVKGTMKSWQSISEEGWKYYFATTDDKSGFNKTGGETISYKGGTSWNDLPYFEAVPKIGDYKAYSVMDISRTFGSQFKALSPAYVINSSGKHKITLKMNMSANENLYSNGVVYGIEVINDKEEVIAAPETRHDKGGNDIEFTCVCDIDEGETIHIRYNHKIPYNNTAKRYTTYPSKIDFTYVEITEPRHLNVPTDFSAYNFVENGKYQLRFKPGDEDIDTYKLFIDDENTELTTVSTEGLQADKKGFYTVDVDSSILEQYAEKIGQKHPRYYSSNAAWKTHKLYLKAVDDVENISEAVETTLRISKNQSANNGIPRIYVVTNNENSDIIKATKTPASLTVKSESSEINNASEFGTIKLRGNSTANAQKKSYNISFDSKQELIPGCNSGKKWCLLANAFDKSMMRNKLAMDIGKTIGGVAAPKEHFVDLYLNGAYMGNYVLSEPAENGRAGVEYNEGSKKNPSKDILFELENGGRFDLTKEAVLRTSVNGASMMFITEDLEDLVEEIYNSGITSESGIRETLLNSNSEFAQSHPDEKWQFEKFKALNNTLNEFSRALQSPSSNDVLKYIDIDSFASMYIVAELFKVVDFGYSSVKFYVTYDNNGKPTIHAGPLWDYDLSTGNSGSGDATATSANGFRSQSRNIWFGQLMRNSAFKNAVIKKYQDKIDVIRNLYSNNALGTSQIKQNYDYIKTSVEKNFSQRYSSGSYGSDGSFHGTESDGAGWDVNVWDAGDSYYSYGNYHYSYNPSGKSYDDHIDYLKNWLNDRNEWLYEQWGNVDITSNSSPLFAASAASIATKSSVSLAKPSVKKIKANSKSLKITWKRKSGVNGYEIQYSTSKKFKKAKIIIIKKSKAKSKIIKKLKRKKKYYIRIRTFKIIKGKIYKSKWSKKKVKKTK